MLMKMDAVLDGRLTADSAEQERYELLKNETLTLARPDESELADIDLADFNTRKKSAVMPGMKALAKKLGIMNVDLQNSRIEIPFQFSNRGLATSLHHQLEYGGSYQDYARMMTCFNELIRNAVPIEIHREKKAKKKALAKQKVEYAQYGRSENLTTIRNLNEDDLEALYGSARIPVQELLTNTEGAGDVLLIVKNEDARNNNAHLENMAAVIPSSVDWWLVERLKMNGLNVVEYKAGNEQARQEAEAKASLHRVPQFFQNSAEKDLTSTKKGGILD